MKVSHDRRSFRLPEWKSRVLHGLMGLAMGFIVVIAQIPNT